MTDRLQRRLAAIVSADVVGYARLMGRDEARTLERLKAHRRELIDAAITEHGGRIVKSTGDGLLLEYLSIVAAVDCCKQVQSEMVRRNAGDDDDDAIRYRVGIHLGDVIVEDDDLFGDGVNLAARLQEACEPGGIAISAVVHDYLDHAKARGFIDRGEVELKNIRRPVRVWQWRADGDEFTSSHHGQPAEQQIEFCAAPDGCMIAYASVGAGPPILKAPNWLNHLEFDWESPVWRHVLRDLSRNHRLVRFDQRGTGLSDRHVPELSFDNMVEDLAATADAAGLDRFALLGISQGCMYSIAYAARYPERVSHLVLYGGFALGGIASGIEKYKQQAELHEMMTLQGWGRNNPAFRQFFTTQFIPGASKEQMDWFNDLQERTTSAETASRMIAMVAHADASSLMAQVKAPTLVLHCRDDAIIPFPAGRHMADGIPNARFVALRGQNHLILEDEPAWPRFMQEVEQFLST